jgi:hypothetical protein
MKVYIVYYKDGWWIPFHIMAVNIYEALDWVHENVQQTGTYIEGVDLPDGPPYSSANLTEKRTT